MFAKVPRDPKALVGIQFLLGGYLKAHQFMHQWTRKELSFLSPIGHCQSASNTESEVVSQIHVDSWPKSMKAHCGFPHSEPQMWKPEWCMFMLDSDGSERLLTSCCGLFWNGLDSGPELNFAGI